MTKRQHTFYALRLRRSLIREATLMPRHFKIFVEIDKTNVVTRLILLHLIFNKDSTIYSITLLSYIISLCFLKTCCLSSSERLDLQEQYGQGNRGSLLHSYFICRLRVQAFLQIFIHFGQMKPSKTPEIKKYIRTKSIFFGIKQSFVVCHCQLHE